VDEFLNGLSILMMTVGPDYKGELTPSPQGSVTIHGTPNSSRSSAGLCSWPWHSRLSGDALPL